MLEWLFRRRRLDREIRDEIEYHLEMLAQEQVERGASAEEAHFAARRKLGNATRAKESTRAVWLSPLVEDVFQDVAYTLRSCRKTPGFFSLVTVILALGIGASVSVFSLVDGILLRPLPYRDPQRIVTLTSYAPRPPFDSNGSVSYNDYLQIKAKTDAFSDVAITFRDGWSRVTLTGGSEPVRVQGAFVSPNLFKLAERSPILGRTFTDDEDRRAERVVVISESLWEERFATSPTVLGRDLEMGHVRWRIIGVAGSDFRLPFLDTQVWAPIHSHPEWNSTEETNPLDRARWDVIAQLKPGVSLSHAQAEVDSVWRGLRAALPEFHQNDVRLVPLREHFSGDMRKPVWLLFGAVVFLLLIACANVANLLLARGAQRSREFAVRSALGAGHARLLRQLMTEAVTFTLIAGASGAVLAYELVPLLRRVAPANTPFLDDVTLSGRGLIFALSVSIAVGLLLGLAPMLRMSRTDRNESQDLAGRGVISTGGGRKLRSVFVAGEFALAMILLTGAGLLLRSFIAVLHVNLGFRPQNVMTLQVGLPDMINPEQTSRIYRQMFQRISALPDVRAVGGVSNLFYLDEKRTHGLRLVEGYPPEPQSKWKPLVWTQVGGDYFQAMEIPLIEGRFFNDNDRPDSPPVLIVNQTLARRYWPGTDPIGRRLKGFDPRGRHDDWLTVVGVVGDIRAGGLERAPFSQIYELQSQRPGEQLGNIVVRSSGNPAPLAASIRSTIRSVNSNAIVSSVSSMGVVLGQQEIQRQFETWLVGVFSGTALLLAALGIFAVMHYSVAARTSEIGIRMAAGATPGDITYLMLGNGTRLAVYGTIAGAITAMWLTRAVAGLLFGVGPSDPVSFFGAALLLITVALLGSWLPAIRASQTDPLDALRQA